MVGIASLRLFVRIMVLYRLHPGNKHYLIVLFLIIIFHLHILICMFILILQVWCYILFFRFYLSNVVFSFLYTWFILNNRFKVILRLIDDSGSAAVVFFNNNFPKLSGYTAWELMEAHGMDPDEYWPQEVDKIIGKTCLFKIYYSDYNVNYNNHTYRCDGFSENVDFINHFKRDFLEEDVTEDVPDEVNYHITFLDIINFEHLYCILQYIV